ncbi:conjugal transfer protein TrbE [Aminobacter aganoensis]|uniref:Type IV secretion system protein VirB4 n=1 Tax=Aminobacter aganoensis TaxID=83264 RepID=A0A7X0FCC9_9HYPH|nr:conjugal transfer protein TrbE [Aminobacter aganoensis]MBB6357100.1 type IV secretion system protein VirB4 [Aminobacter aganoensis]
MVSLKSFRHRHTTFADLLPYAALVDDGVILLKDGSLTAGWYFAGPDLESSTHLERNELTRQMNDSLVRMGSGWMLQAESMRIGVSGYPLEQDCHFPDPVTRAIDSERRELFESGGGHFESKHALILTWRPTDRRKSALTRYFYAGPNERRPGYADEALARFLDAISEIEQNLRNAVSIERMCRRQATDASGKVALYDDLFQFVRFCITGENHPVRLPDVPMYLDWLATAEFRHGLTPTVENRFVSIVAIDGLPSESWPGMLNSLDQLSLPYRWSSRFIFLDEQEVRPLLERTRKKWQQKVRPFVDQLFQTSSRAVDQDALAMVAESEDAIAQATSRLVSYGFYTPVVVMFGKEEGLLRKQAETVRQLVQAEGFGARIETLNATDAYLGSLPGNWYANVREPLINTRNLADLLPLNATWSGNAKAPCPLYPPGSPPLMQVASGSTPFRVNLHVDDVGHTLIFGPTGSGKSTLLAFIAAQFRRYSSAQIFVFDKGGSMLPLTLAAGGRHYTIGSVNSAEKGHDEKAKERLNFCPLLDLANESDRAFACEWLETLVVLQGTEVTPEDRSAINRQIGLMAGSMCRSLSDFVSGVQSQKIKGALQFYTVEGPAGHLLDAEIDTLSLDTFQTFEIEELMNMGERYLVPVLTYLFRRIEKRLTGAPSLIVLDEAWLMLGQPIFREKIREWLKVLRKANCAVVLATQSISDAERSGIIDVLMESCPTKICLPNPAAREGGVRPFYERLGFNSRQIEIVASAQPKRDYYIVSSDGRRLFEMALGPVARAFLAATSKQDIKRITSLRADHGSAWVRLWLTERGVTDAAALLDDC